MSVDEIKKNLKERLTPLQYHVTQEQGTERPFSGEKSKLIFAIFDDLKHATFLFINRVCVCYIGKYNKFYEKGTYICVVCKQELFSSDTKYDSGCGWPAFYDVLEKGKVTLHNDPSLGKRHHRVVFLRMCLNFTNSRFGVFIR